MFPDMCRELLAITDALDVGASRLVLYSSVVLQELYSAEFHLARRRFEKDSPAVSPEEISRSVLEARSFLVRAIEILEPEPQFSSGSKMLELVRKALCECDTWMKEKVLTIPKLA